MGRVKTHNQDVAVRLIDAAGHLLATMGPHAVTVRRVAERVGTSTMAVYTLFGDKSGLLAAMYQEGFQRLGAALRSVPVTDDPLADLFAVGLTYRRWALADRHLYELMFGHPVPGFRPDPAGQAAAEVARRPLVTCVTRCLEAGAFTSTADPGAAERIALHVWGLTHGLVSLELNGWIDGDETARETTYHDALLITGSGYLARDLDETITETRTDVPS